MSAKETNADKESKEKEEKEIEVPAIALTLAEADMKEKEKTNTKVKKPRKKKEAEPKEECPICGDHYTKMYRKKLNCAQCNQECCLRCFQTYLMDNPMQCMYPDCKKALDIVEIRKIVTNNAFCKRLDDALALRMLEEEKTRLPFYQPIAQVEINQKKYKQRNRDRNAKINEISREVTRLRRENQEMYYNVNAIVSANKGDETKEFILEKESYLEKCYQNLHKIADHDMEIRSVRLEDEMDRISVGFIKKERKEYTFIKQCAHPGCNGFLERTWMCSICEKYTCSKCHEPKKSRNDPEHVCNPDIVANVEALKKDSKPCPKCGTGIFKINGCFDGDVEVMMYDSSVKKVKEIVVGDELMGPDNTKRIVQDLCNGEDEMYEVEQKDAKNYIVNSKHTLVLYLNGNMKIKKILDKFYTKWYNSKINNITGRSFDNIDEAKEFINQNYQSPIYEIRVDKFLEMKKVTRDLFKGFKAEFCPHLKHGNEIYKRTYIDVKNIGRGKYYGFLLDNDHRFLLKDYTVTKNCDQMFCIQCQTAFSWNSGKIITGHIHNPEAFRWQREQGIRLRAVPQENQECIDSLSDAYTNWIWYAGQNYFRNHEARNAKNGKNCTTTALETLVRIGIHINAVSIPALQVDEAQTKQNLGVSYLMGRITEEQWLNELKVKMVKKRIMNRERVQVYGFYTGVLSTVLSNIMALVNNRAPIHEVNREFNNVFKLTKQVNQKFSELRDLFKEGRRTYFDSTWCNHYGFRFYLRNE